MMPQDLFKKQKCETQTPRGVKVTDFLIKIIKTSDWLKAAGELANLASQTSYCLNFVFCQQFPLRRQVLCCRRQAVHATKTDQPAGLRWIGRQWRWVTFFRQVQRFEACGLDRISHGHVMQLLQRLFFYRVVLSFVRHLFARLFVFVVWMNLLCRGAVNPLLWLSSWLTLSGLSDTRFSRELTGWSVPNTSLFFANWVMGRSMPNPVFCYTRTWVYVFSSCACVLWLSLL